MTSPAHIRRLLFVALTVASCADPTSRATDDGAGATEPPAEWHLAAEPELRLGVVDGDPNFLFSRILFAGRLSDGRVVVVDGASREIRYFDGTGRFLMRVGGMGEGPGQFRALPRARLMGDTLTVYDSSLRRVTFVGPDGAVIVTVSTNVSQQWFGVTGDFLGVSSDGRHVLRAYSRAELTRAREVLAPGDSVRIPEYALIADSAGIALDTLAVEAGPLRILNVATVTSASGARTSRNLQMHQFSALVLMEHVRDRVFVSTQDRREVRVLDLTDGSARVIRWGGPPTLIGDPELERYRAMGHPEWYLTSAASFKGQPLQTHSRLLLDEAGRIWVQDPQLPWDGQAEPTGWTVLAYEGHVVAAAAAVPGLTIHHISDGHATGTVQDAQGVEYVAVHEIMTTP